MSIGRALWMASRSGDVATVTQILSTKAGLEVEYRGEFGRTPLMAASEHGYAAVGRVLLTHGAHINAPTGAGWTPLHWASYRGNPDCVAALLAHPGVRVNAQDSDGLTALHRASGWGRQDCVAALLAHPGVEINTQDRHGDTALHLACWFGNLTVAELLLHAGADAQLTNNDGKTPTDRLDGSGKNTSQIQKVLQAGKSTPTRAKSSLPKSDSKSSSEVESVKPTSEAKVDSVELKSGKESGDLHYKDKENPTNVRTIAHTDFPQDMAPATSKPFSSPHSSIQKETFSEKHQENLMNRREYFSKNLKFSRDVLKRLNSRGIFGEAQRVIMAKSSSDEEMSRHILDYLIGGKREDFAVLIEILLQTNQRILANVLYRTLPTEEYSELPMPELKSRKIPVFKHIPSSEVIFAMQANERYHQIGSGAFSVVQLATYTAIDAKVAFKRVKGSEYGGISDKDIRYFMKEASTMCAVRHPDIVAIYGTICDTEEHIYGMVMEYLEVGSLSDLMTQIEIPWPVKVRMLNDVCRGLKFLNTPQSDRPYPVTHCDLKASNILINDQFAAKVSDFGQSMLQNITMKTVTNTSSSRGTITHMAPELLDPPDDNYDPTEKSDVWSFGITVFEICAENTSETEERTPFPKKMKDLQIIKTIGIKMQSPFNEQQMQKIPKDCPPFLIDLLKKCCQVEGVERPNFAETAKLLDQHYIGVFKKDIHQAMCQVHRRYGENVLGVMFTADDAEELTSVSSDMQSKLDKVQKVLLSVDQGSAETLESKLDDLKAIFKRELRTTRNKKDRKLIKSVQLEIDATASMAKEEKEKSADEPLLTKLNELEQRLAQHITDQISKLGVYDDSYDFTNSLIQQNYEALVEGIYPDDVMDYLYGALVLSRDEYERIKAQSTTRDKNRLMLIKLDGRGEEGVNALAEALSTTPQKQLAHLLVKP